MQKTGRALFKEGKLTQLSVWNAEKNTITFKVISHTYYFFTLQ
jgi:hypothetical protein